MNHTVQKKTISLILLTLNEIEGLRVLHESINFYDFEESFVIDGGSTDGSIEFLRSHKHRVIIQEGKGRGDAFRTGIREATKDAVLFFSPDGNEDPKTILPLADKLLRGYDMVIASRHMQGGRNEEADRLFPWRAWAGSVFGWIANSLWNKSGCNISDTYNGFRAVTKRAFELMHPDAPGFAIEFQMTIRAMKHGLKVTEIPTQEFERIGGQSTAHSIPTGLLFLRCLLRELWLGNK